MTTPPAVVKKVLAFSMKYPMWGCTRPCRQLRLQSISVSSPTIQSILIENETATRYQRLLKLEEKAHKEKVRLTSD